MKKIISSREGLSPQARMSSELISEHEHDGNSNTSTVALTGQGLKSGLQVVHATPGRVRLRTTDSRFNSILDTISQQLRQQDGVGEVCTNQETGSLVVTFDKNKLSLPQMLEMLQQFGVFEPQVSLQSAKKTEPFAAWQSVDFWKEQGLSFIPLITGLLVTGRLGIHGLPALPVYLVTASATRRVIEQVREQGSGNRDQGEEKFIPSPREATNNTDPLAVQPAIDYSVVHAIPGRVRFHVPRLTQDQAYAQQLQMLLLADAQTTSFRVKRASASLVITYDPGLISDNQMRSVSVSERVTHWVGLIQKAGEAIAPTKLTTATEQPTPESASAWDNLKPPALAASLEFMAKLPVEAVPE